MGKQKPNFSSLDDDDDEEEEEEKEEKQERRWNVIIFCYSI